MIEWENQNRNTRRRKVEKKECRADKRCRPGETLTHIQTHIGIMRTQSQSLRLNSKLETILSCLPLLKPKIAMKQNQRPGLPRYQLKQNQRSIASRCSCEQITGTRFVFVITRRPSHRRRSEDERTRCRRPEKEKKENRAERRGRKKKQTNKKWHSYVFIHSQSPT